MKDVRPGLVRALGSLLLFSAVFHSYGETDFKPEGGNLLPSPPSLVSAQGKAVPGDGQVNLSGPAKGSAAFTMAIPVEPGQEYFFAVDVKSADRLVCFLGGLSMSYHAQGQWQRVCGLIRSNKNRTLDLKLDLRSLEEGRASSAEVKGFVLQKVGRPESIDPVHRSGDTPLVRAGEAQSVIIYPEKNGLPLAEKVQAAIEAKAGVKLPLVSDRDATAADMPVLRPEYRDSHLILIGRLTTNRAFWPAYNRFLTAEDGYYPGGDGYVVRTAANVFGEGKNHLILGGSSDAGVAKAVAKFEEKIKGLEKSADRSLILPWTLDVELGGACLQAFQADDALWKDPENVELPPRTPGYGTVTRWYRNAMGYYWSGWPAYLERSQKGLSQILTDRTYTHQYIVEFLLRAYNMLDESPAIDPKQTAELDSLILKNFLDFLTYTDLSWMTVFSPPYSSVEFSNRHQIAPWYADLLMAKFLDRNVRLGGMLKELVDFRYSEKNAAFRAFVSDRNGPTLPGIAANSDYEEFPATFFRFALENELYAEFFQSGLAHETLALDRFDVTSGRYLYPPCGVDLSMWLGATALLTGDSRYQWLNRQLDQQDQGKSPFQGRYVALVHRYQPDAASPAVEPEHPWTGIQVSPQPLRKDQGEEANTNRFPLITLRGGYKPEDDYVMVAGITRDYPPGALAGLVINGLSVVGAANRADSGSPSRATTNGASAVRLDQSSLPEEKESEGSSATLRWKAQFPGLWAFEVESTISKDMKWIRDLVRLADGQYVFRDTFEPLRPGTYLLRVNWHPSYTAVPDGDAAWQLTTNRAKIRIEKIGPGFSTRQTGNSLAWESVRSMKAGDKATVWTLLQKVGGSSSPWQVTRQSEAQVSLLNAATKRPVILQQGPLAADGTPIAADLVVSEPSGVALFGWKESTASRDIFIPRSTDSPQLAALLPRIEQALASSATTSAPSSPALGDAAIADDSARWKLKWTYDALLRPTQVAARPVTPDIVDFEKLVSLREIRSTDASRAWVPSYLPEEIFVAPATAVQAPASDSPDWIRLEAPRRSRPGVKTGNYGEATPEAHADQSTFPKDVKTRFVKAVRAGSLKYFADDEMAARHPIGLRILRDLPGQSPLVLASSDIFPAFPRRIRDDDFSLAVLRPESGQALCQIDVPGPVQQVLVADQAGRGTPEIFVLKADVSIDVFSLDGTRQAPIDLYAQNKEFQKNCGRGNTRAPAGGHYMPFSFGLWRKNDKGASKFVIGRYGSIMFLDENRAFEGLLNFPSYASPAMLPQGVDFNGDGRDEMLLLERFNLIHIAGEPTPTVREPDGAKFWPQVYEMSASAADDAFSNLLAGAPVHDFEVVRKFGGKSQYVFVVRGNYVGMYDARARKWVLSWQPPAPILTGGLVRDSEERLEFLLATADGLAWDVTIDARRPGRPQAAVRQLPIVVNQIQASPERDGSVLLAAEQGLFLRTKEGDLRKVASGSFTSAAFVQPDLIVAAASRGQVMSFSAQ